MIERRLFAEEHEAFRAAFRRFLDKEVLPHHEAWEDRGYVDREVWRKAGENGFLCPSIPERYGGAGADRRYSMVLMEETAKARTTGLGFSLHSEIVAPYLLKYGTEEQKQRLLPRMARGETIGAIAMTEPGVGSDLQSVKTHAVKDARGNYVLNGAKTFITNGINADLVITAVKTDPTQKHKGMSLLVLERGMDGFERGRNLEKIGQHAQDTAELHFDNVRVPGNNLLGQEGRGFYHLMQNLPSERLSIAISGIAGARATFTETLQYAKDRKAFGQPIGSFQAVQHMCVDMYEAVELARGGVIHALWAADSAEPAERHHAALRAKAFAARLTSVGDTAIQVFGGIGFTWEHDAHLYLKRLLGWSTFLGAPDGYLEQVGAQLVGEHNRKVLQ
jgi:acyl-CoA dehydrogenase